MSFSKYSQFSNIELLKNFLKPILRSNQIISLLILFIRFTTFGFFYNLKESDKDLDFKNRNQSKKFVLDLRDAKINLHLFGILLQFFKSIKKIRNFPCTC